MRPLDGVRVLEIGQYVAAPYCSLLLADLGAEVFKIEKPGGGDPRRAYDPARGEGHGRVSGSFIINNRNKKSVVLDLASDPGRAAFLALTAKSDVIIENLRPGVMEGLGIGYDALRDGNAGLVYCAISGYGRLPDRTGPYTGRPAFDTAIQAMGGIMSVTGEIGGDPVGAPIGFADMYTGVFGALAVVSALFARASSGRGCFIDQAMYDTVISLMGRELMLYDFTGNPPVRGLDEHSPVGAIRASDGFVAVVVPTDEMWRRFCAALGRPDLLDDPRLRTVGDRARKFHTVVKAEAEKTTLQLSREQVVDRFTEAGLPAGVVQTVDEIYRCDQVSARDLMLTIDDPGAGPIHLIRSPFLMSGFDTASAATSPRLGEHARHALTRIAGLSDEAYDELGLEETA